MTDLAPAPVTYSPYDYEVHEDPFPTYGRLRAEAPLYRNDELGFWALSRHEDVIEGFRDFERLSSSHGVSLDPAASGPNAHRTMSFLALDPPMHGRMRGLVSKGFTPRRVAEQERAAGGEMRVDPLPLRLDARGAMRAHGVGLRRTHAERGDLRPQAVL